MKKKTIWSYTVDNWDLEEAKENFFETRGYKTNDLQELHEFMDELNLEYLYDVQMDIERYERWHGQKHYIVLADLGLWNGRQNGGKVIKGLWNAISACFEDCNEIYYDDLLLKVKASHHDGTNHFRIRELTDRGFEYYQNNNGKLVDKYMHDRLFYESHYANHVKMFENIYGL